jgi:hypothetical protein
LLFLRASASPKNAVFAESRAALLSRLAGGARHAAITEAGDDHILKHIKPICFIGIVCPLYAFLSREKKEERRCRPAANAGRAIPGDDICGVPDLSGTG